MNIKPRIARSVYNQVKTMLNNHSVNYVHLRTTVSIPKIVAIQNGNVEIIEPKKKDVDLFKHF